MLASSKSKKRLKHRSRSKAFKQHGRDKAPKPAAHEDNNACVKLAAAPKVPPGARQRSGADWRSRLLGELTQRVKQQAGTFAKGLSQKPFEHLQKKLMGWQNAPSADERESRFCPMTMPCLLLALCARRLAEQLASLLFCRAPSSNATIAEAIFAPLFVALHCCHAVNSHQKALL